MNSDWVIRIPSVHESRLLSCRLLAHVKIAIATPWIWLQTSVMTEADEIVFRALPDAEIFEHSNGDLRRRNDRLKYGRLPPALAWTDLPKAVGLSLPVAGFAGKPGPSGVLRVVRSSKSADAHPNVMETSFSAFAAHALSVATIRLNCWKFAVSATGRCVVLGCPLPSIPGTRFIQNHGVAVPVGFELIPTLSGRQADHIFARSDDVILCWPDEKFERISNSDFVTATRSAVRSSIHRMAGHA